MLSNVPIATIVSAFAGAKARQIKRDGMVLAFVGLMTLLASGALLGAFAVYVAETHGAFYGLLSAAGLAIVLGLFALAIRAWLRMRAKRRQRIAVTSTASAFAISSASSAIAQNKTTSIIAGLVIGLAVGAIARSGRS
ncbi:hypothetical protein IMCC20628_01722 [Hoeflea sp. IMCC20628]|uniref:hypothetical protein n=1 Tax=Hoeflea sp. IMCC20628 TaxID=1620421 RepID=UPI00063AEAE3|nr:hypothetical protein [Hoeflea sp. IMCC20628]AKI00435.1 hypothetical protein IMCC20628_01722 [Hoeflea sp. IMCC20628]